MAVSTLITAQLKSLLEQQRDIIHRHDKQAALNALADLQIEVDSEFGQVLVAYDISDLMSKVSYEYLVDIASPSPDVRYSTEFIHDTWEIPENFICFTSCQGEGGYFLDKLSGKIWDFSLADRDAFMSGDIAPSWGGFYEFVEWFLCEPDTIEE